MGVPDSTMEKWLEGKLNKAVLHFFAIFDDFSKWSALKALRHLEKSSTMPKIRQKMRKSLAQLASNHFSANSE